MFGLTAKPAAKREPVEPDVPRGPSDSDLMNRFVAKKDSEAFAALVDRYGGIVWSVCRRILSRQEDAEDAFQAVFLVLVKQSPSIRNRGAIGSWLYGVAYRTAMKARRKMGRQSELDGNAASPTPEEGPASAAASRELMRVLDEEISLLPEKFRAPFVLCCIEGLSKSEAAQELHWKDGTVSGRLAAARKMLQERLTRRGVRLSAALAILACSREKECHGGRSRAALADHDSRTHGKCRRACGVVAGGPHACRRSVSNARDRQGEDGLRIPSSRDDHARKHRCRDADHGHRSHRFEDARSRANGDLRGAAAAAFRRDR